jgi:hypothetical protein
MSTDDDLLADQILQRLQLSMLPTPADEARNAGAIEARLRLPAGALQLGRGAPAGSPAATDAPGPLPALAPAAAPGASLAVSGGLRLSTQLSVLLAFGAATGVGGYLLGRSESEQRQHQPVAVEVAAVQLAPSVAAPVPPSSAAVVEPAAPGATEQVAIAPAPDARKRAPERRAVRVAQRDVAATGTQPSGTLTLGEALDLLRNAEAAVRNSDGLQARMLLGDLDRRAPAEMLLEERLVTLVLAACALADEPAAREASSRLWQLNPESLYRARLESSCVAEEKRAR